MKNITRSLFSFRNTDEFQVHRKRTEKLSDDKFRDDVSSDENDDGRSSAIDSLYTWSRRVNICRTRHGLLFTEEGGG